MPTSDTVTPELHRAVRSMDAGWLSLVEPWTDDRPDPKHWLGTADLERARREVEEALRAGPGPIVVSGPPGHGKTLLLRALQTRPPTGYAPLFVPFANVEPDELAGWILATTHSRPVRNPAAELAHLLRPNAQSGRRTLLLMDEAQAMPRATLSKLFEITGGSPLAASVVLAGLAGEALDLALGDLPGSTRQIAVTRPWSRADAELLLTQIALELRIAPSDLIAAVDVDAALRASSGNPRLVRAALAARLRVVELPRPRIAASVVVADPQPSGSHDWAASCDPLPTAFPEAPAAARSQRPASAALPERSLEEETGLPRPVSAGAATMSVTRRMEPSRAAIRTALYPRVRRGLAGAAQLLRRGMRLALPLASSAPAMARAIAVLAARAQRNREGSAASLRRAMWAVVAEISHGRRSAARWAFRARAWLDRADRGALVAAERAARSIRMQGQRMGGPTRDRIRAVAIRLRSRSLARGAAVASGARGWARQLRARAANARLALYQRGMAVAAELRRPGAQLSLLPLGSGLMVAATAVIVALVAIGRAPTIATDPSVKQVDTIVGAVGEPIPFRVNSQPWSTVEVDGAEAGATPFTISLEPGRHHFRAAMADGRILEKVLVVSAQEDRLAFR